jgi:hypothetical protein
MDVILDLIMNVLALRQILKLIFFMNMMAWPLVIIITANEILNKQFLSIKELCEDSSVRTNTGVQYNSNTIISN